MGLDGVELIMECEDEFDVHIPDEEALKTITVADLYALICRLRGPEEAKREPSATIQAIRDALQQTGTSGREFVSSARLADLVPLRQRRVFWRLLGQRLGRNLPALAGPPWGCAVALGLMTVCSLIGALLVWQWILLGFILGAFMAAISLWVLQRLRPDFPASCRTVQDVIDRHGPMSGSHIWQRLVKVISEQLGVRPEEITMEKRFVQDLHLG
jgi:acyl carrier protein